jgi:site-specific recombinase XerD
MNPLSPRRKFIAYLFLRQLTPRTVQSYTDWIIQLSRFHNRPPAGLGNVEISSWLLHLIEQRKLSASSINLAINALRSFYGGHLGREIRFLGMHHGPRRVLGSTTTV